MLKEWAAVVAAMASGEQTVLLRKGGILDAASGFVVEARRFLLYPTWEHQGRQNIRRSFWRHLDERSPPVGHNHIWLVAEARDEVDISDGDTVRRLEPFHIWSPQYIDSRRNWQPDRPLKAIFVEAYQIPTVTIDTSGRYGGCRSWLDTDMNIPAGKAVLERQESDRRLEEFQRITS